MKDEKHTSPIVTDYPTRFKVKRRVKIEKTRSVKPLFERIMESLFGKESISERLEKQDPLTSRERIIRALALVGLFFVFFSVSLCHLSFSSYPVGFGLICAIGISKSRFNAEPSLLCAVGILAVLCSCIFVDGYPLLHFALCCAAFLIRLIITKGELNENVTSRCVMATFCAAVCGFAVCVMNGFELTAVFMMVTVAVLSPVVCYLLCGFFPREEAVEDKLHKECALLCLAALSVYSLKEIEFAGLSLYFIISLYLVFAVAKTKGPLYGAVTGMALGLFCNGSIHGAILGLSGFFSGLFFSGFQLPAMLMGFAVSGGYCIFSAGFGEFAAISEDYLICIVAFYFTKGLFSDSEIKGELYPMDTVRRQELCECANLHIKKLSEAFKSISEVFYTVSEAKNVPDITSATEVVSTQCSRICSKCKLSADCWGKRYSETRDMTLKLSRLLLDKGVLSDEDMPSYFTSKCTATNELMEAINLSYRKLCSKCFDENRTRLLAGEYCTVSKLLGSSATELAGEMGLCPDLEQRAKKLLRRLGIEYSAVCVFGRRSMRIDVYGVRPSAIKLGATDIKAAFENEFSCSFDEPEYILPGQRAVLRMRRKRKIVLECAKACRAKSSESISGDTTGFFEAEGDRFYSMLCDGMGSGPDAAATSRLAQIFIEKILRQALPETETLQMLNGFLLSQTKESFTTVDLLEVDMITGGGSFVKAGAAPSFVVRGDNVFKIASRTPPAGILSGISAEKTCLDLRENDYVIMLSDGVCFDSESEARICSVAAAAKGDNPSKLACEILQRVAGEEKAADDMTVFVILVKAA